MSGVDIASLLDDFKNEAGTHIETIESAFLNADTLTRASGRMDGVFRAAHSIKGTAGFFSLHKVVAVSHELESVLTRVRDGALTVDEDITDAVLDAVDCLKALTGGGYDGCDTEPVISRLKKYSLAEKKVEAFDLVQLPFPLPTEAVRRGHFIYFLSIPYNARLEKYYGSPVPLLRELTSVGNLLKARLDGADCPPDTLTGVLEARESAELELLVTSVLEPELFYIAVDISHKFIRLVSNEPAEAKPAPAAAPKGDFTIRLDVEHLNGLLDLANEMILTRNQLLSAASGFANTPGLSPVLQDINRLTSEIQGRIMLTRMQPISVVFNKFPRIIRDTAKELNKDIKVEIRGGDVALDKYMLDAISDPITQLVKNSADHGIEPAEKRAASGKPSSGRITLNAYMREASAVIEVTDDGAGINADSLKKKVIERGAATEEELNALPDSAVYGYIFMPGLSTAEKVTNLSGRGVGMDIVKTNIERLGGSIEVESVVGSGTTVRIVMPLTLSVIRALVVSIGGIQYAVPESEIESIVRVSEKTPNRRLERAGRSLMLNLRGWVLPVTAIEDADAVMRETAVTPRWELLDKYRRRGVTKALVLKAGELRYALLIDDALETEETLVKPLPVYFTGVSCYKSVTVLGNGNTVMILDAKGLLKLTGIKGVATEKHTEQVKNERQLIYFKCSGAEYFAVDASRVARVERVSPGQLQTVADGEYINVGGKTVRALWPEDYAKVTKRVCERPPYLVVLKEDARQAAMPMALLAGGAPNRAGIGDDTDESRFKSEYVLGSVVFNEKILLILDIDKIIG